MQKEHNSGYRKRYPHTRYFFPIWTFLIISDPVKRLDTVTFNINENINTKVYQTEKHGDDQILMNVFEFVSSPIKVSMIQQLHQFFKVNF